MRHELDFTPNKDVVVRANVGFLPRAKATVALLGLVALTSVSGLSGCSVLKKARLPSANQTQDVSSADSQEVQEPESSVPVESAVSEAQQEPSQEATAEVASGSTKVQRADAEIQTTSSEPTPVVVESSAQPVASQDVVSETASNAEVEPQPAASQQVNAPSAALADAQAAYLADNVISAMPLGQLIEHSKQQDAAWPLGRFSHKLQREQINCVRLRINTPAYHDYMHTAARRFVATNPDLVVPATRVMDEGGSKFLRLMSQAVLDKVAKRENTTPDIANALLPEEKGQVVALLQSAEMQPLRDLVGISKLRNPSTGKTENNYTKRVTNTLTLLALQQCGVDARALLK